MGMLLGKLSLFSKTLRCHRVIDIIIYNIYSALTPRVPPSFGSTSPKAAGPQSLGCKAKPEASAQGDEAAPQ